MGTETLFTTWIGINDFWDGKGDPVKSVTNIKTGLQKLIDKGGKFFLVFNAFDITPSPAYGKSTEYHHVIPQVQQMTQTFNSELYKMLFYKIAQYVYDQILK